MKRTTILCWGISCVLVAALGCARDRSAASKNNTVGHRSEAKPSNQQSTMVPNRFIEFAAAGDLDALRKAVAENSNAVHSKWTRRRKASPHVDDDTALHLASKNGHLQVVQFLLEHQAAASAANVTGDTPLHYAANAPIARALLKAGATVDAAGNLGRTPLHHAQDRDVAEALLKAGANVHHTAPNGDTPFLGAAKNGRIEVARLLMERGAATDVKPGNKCGPLTWAVTNQHLEMVRFLLDNGVKVDQKNRLCDPLVEAVEKKDQPALAQLLIARGADARVKVKHPSDPTLLHWAVSYGGKAKIVDLLLDAGVPIDATTGERDAGSFQYPLAGGRTALHLAAERGYFAAAKRLIERGANVRAQTTAGATPLELAEKVAKPKPQEIVQGTPSQVESWNDSERRGEEQRQANRRKIAALLRKKLGNP